MEPMYLCCLLNKHISVILICKGCLSIISNENGILIELSANLAIPNWHLPSWSYCFINSLNSCFEKVNPSCFITVPNSFLLIALLPSSSKRSNAALNSTNDDYQKFSVSYMKFEKQIVSVVTNRTTDLWWERLENQLTLAYSTESFVAIGPEADFHMYGNIRLMK